jgi:Protein kinase domain
MPWEPLRDDPPALGGYRLSGRIGAGGMGRVYLAFTPAGRPVAMKVMRPELGEDPEFRARFRQEIAAAQRVSGLFTAQVLDGDPDGSPPWLVTAYVPGPSLAQAVAGHGPLPQSSVLLLMAGVAEALQAIHAAGLVHRDLKPSNVLLAADGPRVIDFGIARAVQAPMLTRTGFRVGSPQFMAPEQVQGGPVTAAADVFALGALAACAATGRPPFGEGDEAALLYRVLHAGPDLSGCPGPLLGLIQWCLAKDPAARPVPAQIIEQCRSRVPASALEFTAAWLPPAIAAGLARRDARLPAAASSPAQAATAPPPWAAPTLRRTAVHPDGPPPRRRRLSRAALTCAVAAGAAALALASYGLVNLVSSPSAPLDTCLFGTWTVRSVTADNYPVAGVNAAFASHGFTVTFLADGVTSTDYGAGATLTTNLDGVTWTVVYTGSFTARYTTRNRTLVVSDGSGHGGYTVLRNGSYSHSGPLPLPPSSSELEPYVCSADTLQVSMPHGISQVLARNPARP